MNKIAIQAYWWASINRSLQDYRENLKGYLSSEGNARAGYEMGMEVALADARSKWQICRSVTG